MFIDNTPQNSVATFTLLIILHVLITASPTGDSVVKSGCSAGQVMSRCCHRDSRPKLTRPYKPGKFTEKEKRFKNAMLKEQNTTVTFFHKLSHKSNFGYLKILDQINIHLLY